MRKYGRGGGGGNSLPRGGVGGNRLPLARNQGVENAML
jgi:hypothetical protein